MTSIRQRAADANQVIEAQKNTIISAATQSLFDSTADIMRTGFGEQSAIYKVAFAASKAFAIADSMVKIQQAIASGAVSAPYPANIIAMASIAAQTASIVSNIQAVSGVGFASGGYTGPGGKYQPAGIVHKESTSSTRHQRTGSACLSLRHFEMANRLMQLWGVQGLVLVFRTLTAITVGKQLYTRRLIRSFISVVLLRAVERYTQSE